MDGWRAGGYRGDGNRDFLSNPDPYSPPHSFQPDEVNLRTTSRNTGSRLDFDGLDRNSESDGFSHLGSYQGFLQGTDDLGRSAGSGTVANAALGGSAALPPHPSPRRARFVLVEVVVSALDTRDVTVVVDVHLRGVLMVQALLMPRLQEAKPCSSMTTVRPPMTLPLLLTRRYNSSTVFPVVLTVV